MKLIALLVTLALLGITSCSKKEVTEQPPAETAAPAFDSSASMAAPEMPAPAPIAKKSKKAKKAKKVETTPEIK